MIQLNKNTEKTHIMTPEEFLLFLHKIEKLKNVTRHCLTSSGRRESVAEHSYRLCVMALLLRGEFPEIDTEKVLDMCIIHDFGEAVTGDIPCFKKTEDDEKTEARAIIELLDLLPDQKERFLALYEEMNALTTKEARLYKSIDQLEAVLSHNESPLSSWEPHEYKLNVEYGTALASEFPFMKKFRALLLRDTENKTE